MKKINVLETIRQGQVGGGETHMYELVKRMDKNRFKPVVLSFTDGEMVKRVRGLGIKVFIIPTTKPFNPLVWPKVKQLIHEKEIDLVHAHGTRACSNTFQAAARTGTPLIYTVHGWSFHSSQPGAVQWLRKRSERLLLNKANRTILVSDSNFQDGLDNKFNMERANVIKNGIDTEFFSPDSKQGNIREELGVTTDDIIIGLVARITEQKNPLMLVRAFSKLARSNPKVKLLIVGDGDLKEETIHLVQELGTSEQVIFQPFRSDVPALLDTIDIYCLPSLWEGLSIGLLEAMSMGKAIIASSVDGNKEVITNNINGLLIDSTDEEGLTKAIELLSVNKDLRDKLGVRARDYVKTVFGVERMVQETCKLYQETCHST